MFTVTIVRSFIRERPSGKEWKQIGKTEGNSDGFGYTPEIVRQTEIELKIYEQIVDFLDIKNVIDAVNNGPKPFLKRRIDDHQDDKH